MGEVTRNQFLLRLKVDRCETAVFPDTREIVSGTGAPAATETVGARYVSN